MPLNKVVLIPLYLGAAVGPMGSIGIIPLIPTFVNLWNVEFGSASLALSLYMTPFIAVQIFSGSIAKLLDVRRVLLFGFSTYVLGAGLCFFASSLSELLSGRVIQGVGAGFITPIIMAHIGEIVPERHMGKAMGMLGVSYTFGVTAGPFFAGFIEVRYGWSGFFLFLAVMGAIAGLAYWILGQRSVSRNRGMPSLVEMGSLLLCAVREPGVLQYSFAAFSLFFAYIGIMTFTADYLRSSVGLSSDWVGSLLSITGISGIIVSPLAGFCGDRVGRRNIFLVGVVIALVSVSLMISLDFSFVRYLWLFFLFGSGAATGWTSLNTMAVQASSSLRQPVTSIYSALKFSGYAVAPVALSLLYGFSGLKTVQGVCLGAILISSCLAVRGESAIRGA